MSVTMKFVSASGFVLVLLAQAAAADVGSQHLPFLKSMKFKETSQRIIAELGAPDYVILPTDKSDEGPDLRENGIAKQLVWNVKGCQPLRMDFDAQSRQTGVNFSMLTGYCFPEVAKQLTPPAAYACKRDDRKNYCS